MCGGGGLRGGCDEDRRTYLLITLTTSPTASERSPERCPLKGYLALHWLMAEGEEASCTRVR